MVSSMAVTKSGTVCSSVCEFAGEFFVFASGDGVAAEEIDGAAFGGGGEPCAGVVGDAGLRPLLECGDEGFLREVFGEADVAGEAGEAGDDARGLDAPDGFDGAMGLVWIGSGHCYRSHQLWIRECKWGYLFAGLSCQLSAEVFFLLDTSSDRMGAKSSISKTWRISTSQSPVGLQLGPRLTHSMASSRDLTCQRSRSRR